MPKKILLITPPFTQLNTPYPASPYLKGFLTMHGYAVFQADLGIELINKIFSRDGFQELFSLAKTKSGPLSSNSLRIIRNEESYGETVGLVMRFCNTRTTRLPSASVLITFFHARPASTNCRIWSGASGAWA